MIERLLAADAALERDDLATAAKLFAQVAEADPRNAIAAVGLGRVAAGRDDAAEARMWFLRALEIDPEEAAAKRLLAALDRELAATAAATAAPRPGADTTAPRPGADMAAPRPAAKRRSLRDRVRAWLGLRGRRV
jgi:tetratricopeptide (TPR) repeat protein